MKNDGSDRGGSALIVVLWITILLSALVASFAFDMHIESRITAYYKNRLKAEYLAQGGLVRAELLMSRGEKMRKSSEEDKEEFKSENWYHDAKRLSEGLAIRNLVSGLGEGIVTLNIEPEPARRNVNRLTTGDWERILEIAGVPDDMWEELIDSFYDWTDKDDQQRMNGGENSYYESLEPAYRSKNGPLDSVDELLLVKGFTREMVYGGLPKDPDEDELPLSGMIDMLTTYGDGRVNVNAASERVLMTLPDVDSLTATIIVEEREEGLGLGDPDENISYKNINDFYTRIQEVSPALRKQITTDSKIYRVTARGIVNRVEREISCIVNFQKGKMAVLRWREQDL